jgi:hypothetical protein
MLGWQKLSKYCDETGDTPSAVDCRVRTGHWLEGVHVRVPTGSRERWANLAAIADWCAGRVPVIDHGKRR